MTDQFTLYRRPIEIETHPRWATHYIQKIDIVDITTGKTVETVTAFDRDGHVAAEQARQLAHEAIQRRRQEKECSSTSDTSSS